jgi:hypothetical protein
LKTKTAASIFVGVHHDVFLHGQTDSLPGYGHLCGFVSQTDSKPVAIHVTKYRSFRLKGQDLTDRKTKPQKVTYIITHAPDTNNHIFFGEPEAENRLHRKNRVPKWRSSAFTD